MSRVRTGHYKQQSTHAERVIYFWLVIIVTGVIVSAALMYFGVIKSPNHHREMFTTPVPEPGNFSSTTPSP